LQKLCIWKFFVAFSGGIKFAVILEICIFPENISKNNNVFRVIILNLFQPACAIRSFGKPRHGTFSEEREELKRRNQAKYSNEPASLPAFAPY
jgi:hypothetical protein